MAHGRATVISFQNISHENVRKWTHDFTPFQPVTVNAPVAFERLGRGPHQVVAARQGPQDAVSTWCAAIALVHPHRPPPASLSHTAPTTHWSVAHAMRAHLSRACASLQLVLGCSTRYDGCAGDQCRTKRACAQVCMHDAASAALAMITLQPLLVC